MSTTPTERERLIHLAKLSEQCGCYEEMAKTMKKVIHLDPHLSNEERNLIAISYKNQLNSKRFACRVIYSLEAIERGKNPQSWKHNQLNSFIDSIIRYLENINEELVSLIDQILLPAATDMHAKIFWLKLKGDFCRYIAEYLTNKERQVMLEKAFDAYKDAMREGKEMKKTDPLLLGLVLNFSVFYYEMMGDMVRARELAKGHFDDAMLLLIGGVEGEEDKDTVLLLQLLRDNLSLWSCDDEYG